MQSANPARETTALWVMCVVVPLVCVAACGTIGPFIFASISLLVTTAQALKTASFSRTSTPDGLSHIAVWTRGRLKHLLVMLIFFSVCTLLLLTLGSRFGGGINLLLHGSVYVNH